MFIPCRKSPYHRTLTARVRHTVEAELGSTVMETALRNDIASIVAECGGSLHLRHLSGHVDDAWSAVVGPPSAEEEEMLDSAFEVKPTSRLSCQIKVTEALDGLIVHTPGLSGPLRTQRSRGTIQSSRASRGHTGRSTRVSISLRRAPKSIGLVRSASAPLSSALRFVSASP